MTLPTDVALKSSGYEGSTISRLAMLDTGWIFSWPDAGQAPFMEEVSLFAGEEFGALVFNALHGYYRQAIGCLRNAFETLITAAGLAVTGNQELFNRWRKGERQIGFGQARAWLRDSALGRQIDSDATPYSIFGDDNSSWTKSRYVRLCAYAHSQAGYNNADFWESNGPVFVPSALLVVEREFRETLLANWSGTANRARLFKSPSRRPRKRSFPITPSVSRRMLSFLHSSLRSCQECASFCGIKHSAKPSISRVKRSSGPLRLALLSM